MHNKEFRCYSISEDSERRTVEIKCFEFENEDMLNNKIFEIRRSGALCVRNIWDIDFFKLHKDLRFYNLIIDSSFLMRDGYPNIQFEEILSICNRCAPFVKSVIIDSIFPIAENDYIYNSVTQSLLSNYDRIDYPSKIKCRKDRQSGDDDYIADIKTVKETDEAMELAIADIQKYNFSPLEKVIAATILSTRLVPIINGEMYEKTPNKDMIRKFGSDLYDSLYTNTIICAGYIDIFIRVLEKLGIDVELKRLRTYADFGYEKAKSSGHATSIVTINDKKYDVYGPYFFDIAAIGSLFDVYIKKFQMSSISFYDNLVYPKGIHARLFGRGKDGLAEYARFAEGLAGWYITPNKELSPYVEDVSEKSIPLEIIKAAADYVESKFVLKADGTQEKIDLAKYFEKWLKSGALDMLNRQTSNHEEELKTMFDDSAVNKFKFIDGTVDTAGSSRK